MGRCLFTLVITGYFTLVDSHRSPQTFHGKYVATKGNTENVFLELYYRIGIGIGKGELGEVLYFLLCTCLFIYLNYQPYSQIYIDTHILYVTKSHLISKRNNVTFLFLRHGSENKCISS